MAVVIGSWIGEEKNMRDHRLVSIRGVRFAIVLWVALVLVGLTVPALAGGMPSISGFSPSSGPPGTLVTVSGANFTGVSAVAFNSVATTFSFVDDGHVVASVPTGAGTGKISVGTTGGTAQSAANFVVTAPAPVISGFSPSNGPAGTQVTINGTNFTGANGVAFNGVGAAFTFVNAGRVTATVPASASTGRITVSTPSGTAQSASNFTVGAASPPTIGSIDPTSGPVGSSVVIKGSRFSGATVVTFNGVGATFKVNKGSKITATVPAGATSGPVSVTTPSGSATFASFTVTLAGAPTITSLTPTSGPVGTAVKIKGTNLSGATSVKFNGVAAVFSVDDSTKISTHVPTGATTGPVTVTTGAGTATSSTFTVGGGGPTVTGFTPSHGKIGDEVTIKGSKLTGTTSVTFNGVTSVFSVKSDSKIKATVPPNARTGKIVVTSPAGTSTSADDFTVDVVLHLRSISLHLFGRLNASGLVTAPDDYKGCVSQIPVVIQRLRAGEWRWMATTATRKNGAYRIYLRNLRGRYRAVAKRIVLVNGQICGSHRSRIVLNHHRPGVRSQDTA